MPAKSLLSFAQALSLSLTTQQRTQLTTYANCVWEKKDFLNLTSVETLEEIFNRHLADGFIAAAQIQSLTLLKKLENITIGDVGSGAGYIGFALAIALPQARVTCVESLEKRCGFMNWAALKSGITNIQVKKARLGQGTHFQFDFVTERAMGKLEDILTICLSAVKPGGIFLAYQGNTPPVRDNALPNGTVILKRKAYTLPCNDGRERYLAIFEKKV